MPEGNPRASAGCWRTSHLGYTSSEKQSIVITDVGKPNARGISVKLVFRSCKTLPYKLSLVKYVPQMRFDSSCSHIQCCDLIQPDEYISPSPRFSGIRKHSASDHEPNLNLTFASIFLFTSILPTLSIFIFKRILATLSRFIVK